MTYCGETDRIFNQIEIKNRYLGQKGHHAPPKHPLGVV